MRFLLVVLLGAGCGARSGLLPLLDGGERDATHGAPARDLVQRSDAGCRVLLSVGAVKATPASCWIDQKVANRTAVLAWSCESGEAVASFAVPFPGTVAAGVVALQATTLFSWSDGCTWQSRQTIDGLLSSGSLTYRYAEEPIKGTGCAPAYCKASATVLVH